MVFAFVVCEWTQRHRISIRCHENAFLSQQNCFDVDNNEKNLIFFWYDVSEDQSFRRCLLIETFVQCKQATILHLDVLTPFSKELNYSPRSMRICPLYLLALKLCTVHKVVELLLLLFVPTGKIECCKSSTEFFYCSLAQFWCCLIKNTKLIYFPTINI